jgi:hypothetical protein
MHPYLVEAAARFVIQNVGSEYVGPEELPAVASRALELGLESPSLVLLAGAVLPSDAGDQQPLFLAALRELGISLPSQREAAEFMKRRYAQDVVQGSLAPREGAARIVRLYHAIESQVQNVRYAADGFGIAELFGDYHAYDDIAHDNVSPARIDEAIRNCCARIMAGEAG